VPRFAFVGRIEPNKGVEWFLRAAARCDAPFRVDLAGTGSEWYGDFIRRRIDELGLSARVTVHGWLSEAEVQAVYQRARAVVVPSLWHEPAGLVTLEAGASGRAVIVSRVGGIPEYADSSFALMCDPGDVEAMANHLSSLTNDWDTARTMGEAGYDTMRRRFTLNEFLARVDDVYAVARDRFAADRSSRTASSTQV
jgi:glycosyltransferase involved in cell wall biosynthesis